MDSPIFKAGNVHDTILAQKVLISLQYNVKDIGIHWSTSYTIKNQKYGSVTVKTPYKCSVDLIFPKTDVQYNSGFFVLFFLYFSFARK